MPRDTHRHRQTFNGTENNCNTSIFHTIPLKIIAILPYHACSCLIGQLHLSYRKFRVCSCWNSAPLFRVFRAHIPRCSAETEIPHLADLDARITRGTAGYIARTARSLSFSLLDISIRCVAGIIYRHIALKFVENVWLRNQGRSVFIDFNYFILQRSKC